MKIFGLMLVKDEADIIAEVLNHGRQWADRIIVQDNGSTDGTWEIVQDMADDVIVAWKQDLRTYNNTLRADAFNAFRHEAEQDDWWCYKMDSDEFYVDDPREFLAAVPWPYHVVFKKSIDYVITSEDVREHTYADDFEANRSSGLYRYVKPVAHSEARFFRHRNRLDWPAGTIAPKYRGPRYPKPILVRHYQFRSPQQMQRRLDLRNAVPKDKQGKPFRHIRQTHWQELLVPRSDAIPDQGRETYDALPARIKSEKVGRGGVGNNLLRALRFALHALRILP
ncbi:MAG: glycosyltransferase family 2 protein [Spirochaetaceae bacterium]